MPNRILRDWTRSDTIDKISAESERFFTRLIMKADDFGCFHADTRFLKVDLFPLKLDKIREADLLRWMVECQKAGLIALYVSEGKSYLQINDFRQRLDRKVSRFPRPDNEAVVRRVADGNLSRLEVEVETEVEVERERPPDFWDKEEKRKRPLVECLSVSLNDHRWISKNKTSESELKAFNDYLEGSGETEKTLKDYKKHFHNLKSSNPNKLKTNESSISKSIAAIKASA